VLRAPSLIDPSIFLVSRESRDAAHILITSKSVQLLTAFKHRQSSSSPKRVLTHKNNDCPIPSTPKVERRRLSKHLAPETPSPTCMARRPSVERRKLSQRLAPQTPSSIVPSRRRLVRSSLPASALLTLPGWGRRPLLYTSFCYTLLGWGRQ
jgi:hypothetical protein